jgi:hypothetical protein
VLIGCCVSLSRGVHIYETLSRIPKVKKKKKKKDQIVFVYKLRGKYRVTNSWLARHAAKWRKPPLEFIKRNCDAAIEKHGSLLLLAVVARNIQEDVSLVHFFLVLTCYSLVKRTKWLESWRQV